MHCAQTAEDIDRISIVSDSPMSLPDRVKILLTNFAPNQFDPPPVELSVGEWLEIAQWSQLRAYTGRTKK